MSERILSIQEVPRSIAESYKEFIDSLPGGERDNVFYILGIGAITRSQIAAHMLDGDPTGVKLANIFISSTGRELTEKGRVNMSLEDIISETVKEFRGDAKKVQSVTS